MASQVYAVFALTIYLLVAVTNGSPAVNNLNNFKQFIPFEKIEAEDYSYADYATTTYCDVSPDAEFIVEDLSTMSYLEYADVDFGTGAEMVTIRLANINEVATVSIYLHLGSTSNLPIGTLQVTYTGSSPCDFQTFVGYLDTFPTGAQDLYLTFPSATIGVLAIDYFYFNRTVSLH